jgi:O-acetyl-ADP-ribose deacetylase (regulator of RNase III)
MKVECVLGDITVERVDAVVNAANSSLLGGGGVDGALHAAAGPELLAQCRRVRAERYPDGLPVGAAVVTGAGRLAARWVVHTVGPDARRGQTDPALLASCFASSLHEAAAVGAASVAFPAISAGVYGWDVRDVARIGVRTVLATADDVPSVSLVRFVLFSPPARAAFADALADGAR